MADEQKSEKKLIIDEDWKKQAQQEKETLAAKEKEEKQKQQASQPEGEGPSGPLPPGDLASLINMLTTQALFAMGVLRVQGQEEREPDLEMARYNIDMLETLEEKTKGNLTPEEAQVLRNTLSELRMGYVQIAQHGAPPAQGE